MDFQVFKSAAAEEAAKLNIEEYELYCQLEDSVSASAFKREINGFSDSGEGGACLRCLVEGRMGYASTQRFTEDSARALVRRARDNAAALETAEPEFLVGAGGEYQAVRTENAPLPGAEALRRTALRGQEALYSQEGVVDGSETEVFGSHIAIAISNSKGLDLQYENSVSGAVLSAVVSDGSEEGEKASEYKITLGEPEGLDLLAAAEETAGRARETLGAGTAPTGVMPVVFSADAMSQLLATFSPVFSAENVQKGLSLLKDREGTEIAAPIVTLIDDPFYEKAPLPMPFDAEGSPTRRKSVIEKGVLRTLLYNLRTAAAAGKETTGNASKAGSGVLITSLGGLHAGANPISGDFSLQSSGFLIEGGKKGAPVRSFTVAGNFFTLLKNITAVGSDVKTPTSPSFTTFISPSVLAQGLSVAGK